MDSDARLRAEHALGPWGERPVDSTPETREELIRNVADAVAQAIEEERIRHGECHDCYVKKAGL